MMIDTDNNYPQEFSIVMRVKDDNEDKVMVMIGQ